MTPPCQHEEEEEEEALPPPVRGTGTLPCHRPPPRPATSAPSGRRRRGASNDASGGSDAALLLTVGEQLGKAWVVGDARCREPVAPPPPGHTPPFPPHVPLAAPHWLISCVLFPTCCFHTQKKLRMDPDMSRVTKRVKADPRTNQPDAFFPVAELSPELINKICMHAWSREGRSFYQERDAIVSEALGIQWHPGVKKPPHTYMSATCTEMWQALKPFRMACVNAYVRSLHEENIKAGLTLSYALWNHSYVMAMKDERIVDGSMTYPHVMRPPGFRHVMELRGVAQMLRNGIGPRIGWPGYAPWHDSSGRYHDEDPKMVNVIPFPVINEDVNVNIYHLPVINEDVDVNIRVQTFMCDTECRNLLKMYSSRLMQHGTEPPFRSAAAKEGNCFKALERAFNVMSVREDERKEAAAERMLECVEREVEIRQRKLQAQRNDVTRTYIDEVNKLDDSVACLDALADEAARTAGRFRVPLAEEEERG